MTFKPYEILSALLPGFLLLIALFIFLDIPYQKDYIVAYTAIAFLIGFVVSALSSWLEGVYYFTWGGKPSERLLNGKSVWKVPFYEAEKVKSILAKHWHTENVSNDALYALAIRYANGHKDSRINEFSANYAFARVLLTTLLLILCVMLYAHYGHWQHYLFLCIVLIIVWLRCKQRAYYYAREVLNEYLNGHE
ncbi:hypothetical protein SAMN05216480_10692 [Pustulibacterium marinum]|uniref:Uncharacterized protein n=1 Tax=Pustulibacterium marinum TaxID=1224947 RepID=A0A1I7GYD2_9FLAO|nr:hypothetical protein [Pustulibacterium marinum]SFU53405.1 hypothetical protein SAMN05216480_10692 [Pustulibacterium marinum]